MSGENHRDPPGDHKRWWYCFWLIFKIIGHFDQAAVLDFGQRKNGNQFFLNPDVSKM